jgi:hypothetical protein
LQVNWVFDEFFVQPAVWRDVFEPRGVAARPVLDTRGRQLETVVQLDVREEVELDASDLPATPCPTCGRSKYSPTPRGMFPALRGNPSAAMVKSVQYFGSGASAWHATIVSGELRTAIAAVDPHAGSFRPANAWLDA